MSLSKKNKQKLVWVVLLLGLLVLIVGLGCISETKPKDPPSLPGYTEKAFHHQDPTFSPENIRFSRLEQQNEKLSEQMETLSLEIKQTKEDKDLLEKQNEELLRKQRAQDIKLQNLEKKQDTPLFSEQIETQESLPPPVQTQVWSRKKLLTSRNVVNEIPAGTVVKCVLLSAVDCSVGLHTSSDPSTVLLQPLANGKLPKKVQVALKGSRIIGTAIGDIASERVKIRAEKITRMIGSNGDFVETSIAGFVSGEDGKEGMRGVVADRSGAIIARATIASFLQGVGSSVQAALNNQTIAKLSRVGDTQSILNVDTFRDAGIGGANTGLNKLAEYYIKKAEQLQPVIQIEAERVVDVIFLKSVKLGDANIEKDIQKEREQRGLS